MLSGFSPAMARAGAWSSVRQDRQYLRSCCCTVVALSEGHNSYGTLQRKDICSRKNGWIQGCGGRGRVPGDEERVKLFHY